MLVCRFSGLFGSCGCMGLLWYVMLTSGKMRGCVDVQPGVLAACWRETEQIWSVYGNMFVGEGF